MVQMKTFLKPFRFLLTLTKFSETQEDTAELQLEDEAVSSPKSFHGFVTPTKDQNENLVSQDVNTNESVTVVII